MGEFLNSHLFHWTPAKAIWLGGHTLSWDARCAGIYIGFGLGALYMLAAEWNAWRMPSVRVLAGTTIFALPLLVDVVTITYGPRAPSNDARYLTGLLLGGALSRCLVPAFMFVIRARPHGETTRGAWQWFVPPLSLGAVAFLGKQWDSVIAYGLLEALAVFGCGSLIGILAVGTVKLVGNGVSYRRAAKRVSVVMMILVLAGCAVPTRSLMSDVCDVRDFRPSRDVDGVCRTAVCTAGKVVVIDNPGATAPVNDWAEENFCLRHPINCYRAWALKKETERWQKSMAGKYWPPKERNGLADAGRHAHFMCVVAERFGAEFARGLGLAHEEDSEYLIFTRKAAPGNPCCEKTMDLYNNEIGIMLAGQPGSCEEKVLRSHLLRYASCPVQGTGTEYQGQPREPH